MINRNTLFPQEQIDTEAFLEVVERNPSDESIMLADNMIGIASHTQPSHKTLDDLGRLFTAISSHVTELMQHVIETEDMTSADTVTNLYKLAQRVLNAKTLYLKNILSQGPLSTIPYSGIAQEEKD